MYMKPTIRIGKYNAYYSSYQKKSHGNRYDQLLTVPAEEHLDAAKKEISTKQKEASSQSDRLRTNKD